MRRANGMGSVHKIDSKARRKPYVARISVWDEEHAKRKRIVLGTFKTSKEAYECLTKFEAGNQKKIAPINATLKDIIDEAYQKLESFRSESICSAYRTAIRKLQPLWNVPISNLNGTILQDFFDDQIKSGLHRSALLNEKTIIKEACQVAIRKGYLNVNFGEALDVRNAKRSNKLFERRIFTHDEIEKLWTMFEINQYARISLIMLYTGCRINGAFNLCKDDIDLANKRLTIRESKTQSSYRVIPICDKIMPIFEDFINFEGTFDRMKNVYYKAMKSHGLDHRSHDCRHTLISYLNDARLPNGERIDINIIKILVGHQVSDVTKGTYTHEKWDKLVDAVQTLNDM